jgi:hypothetical protein
MRLREYVGRIVSGYSMLQLFSTFFLSSEVVAGKFGHQNIEVVASRTATARHVEQVAINSLAGTVRGGDFSRGQADRLKGRTSRSSLFSC